MFNATLNPRWTLAMEMERAERPDTPDFRSGRTLEMAAQMTAHCDDVSEESITVLLLGSARFRLTPQNDSNAVAVMAKHALGERASDLLAAMRADPHAMIWPGKDQRMTRDWVRLQLCESTMRLRHAFAPDTVADLSLHEAKRWAETQKSCIADANRLIKKVGVMEPNLKAVLQQAIEDATGVPTPRKARKPEPGLS